jgi:tubulin polyglutamylase TTLL6/13
MDRDAVSGSICQVYLERPLLIEEFKFDLRLYVLVTSCSPLRIFMFDDGLVRFATIKYKAPTVDNIGSVMQHLTNYSLNKESKRFVDSESAGEGSKRKVAWLWDYLASKCDLPKLKTAIDDIIIKTLISSVGVVGHSYRACTYNNKKRQHSACFEILGFDIMLDTAYKPWLIEVNHAPSFRCDSALDKDVKERVVDGAMRLVALNIAEGPPTSQPAPGPVRAAARPVAMTLEEKRELRAKKQRLADKKQAEFNRKLAVLEDEAIEGTGYTRTYPQNGNETLYAELLAFGSIGL